VDRGSL
jgi:hypothetical protein